jgi:hypothetical protein
MVRVSRESWELIYVLSKVKPYFPKPEASVKLSAVSPNHRLESG